MAGPRQARSTTAAASRGSSTKKDKGTRGGRPEAARPAAARPGGGQARRPAGQPGPRGSRPDGRRASATATAAASQARPATRIAPLWFQLTTWALAIFGLGVSTYLTVAHYTSSSILACSDKGLVNCALVTTSPESVVFSVFPVAVLGLAFYVFLTAATSPWAWRLPYPVVAWARLASVIIGIVFVLYLIYTELFTLNAICLWCTIVHVTTFLLFALIVTSAAIGYGFRDPELAR